MIRMLHCWVLMDFHFIIAHIFEWIDSNKLIYQVKVQLLQGFQFGLGLNKRFNNQGIVCR